MHGITFEEYAAACAYLAQGRPVNEVIATLQVNEQQWTEAETFWQQEMANDPEFKLVTVFGEVFGNPARGRFAGQATQTTADALKKIDSFERFIDIGAGMDAAGKAGVDPQHFLQSKGLTVMDWSQAGMHWGKYHLDHTDQSRYTVEEINAFQSEFSRLSAHYAARYEKELSARY